MDGHISDNKLITAKQCLAKSIDKYIEQELKQKNYFQNEEAIELMKWLYDNEILSIKREIIMNNVTLSMLKQCRKNDIENLIKEMKLTTATAIEFRSAFNRIKTGNNVKIDKKCNHCNRNYTDLIEENEQLKQEIIQLKQVKTKYFQWTEHFNFCKFTTVVFC